MPKQDEKPMLRIDLGSATPVYQQIVNSLRALLVSGAFAPGARLPTVREVAIDLGVNHNTVAEAYRVLAEEGWLELKRHHGATVIPRPFQPAEPGRQDDFVQRLRELAARAIADGVDQKEVARLLGTLAENLKQPVEKVVDESLISPSKAEEI
jgi:DNA-binding transcriptional regulator YhcF (GntR family)